MGAIESPSPRRPPLSAEVAVLVCVLAGERYALRLSAVERVLPMVALSTLPGTTPLVLGVFNLHGVIIPVLDLRQRLGLSPVAYGLEARLIVARARRWTIALPVDGVLGAVTYSADLMMPTEHAVPGGAAVPGLAPVADGMLFVYDLDAFLSLDEERQLARALAEEPAP